MPSQEFWAEVTLQAHHEARSAWVAREWARAVWLTMQYFSPPNAPERKAAERYYGVKINAYSVAQRRYEGLADAPFNPYDARGGYVSPTRA